MSFTQILKGIIEARLGFLYMRLDELGMRFEEHIYNSWDDASAGMNEGQLAILSMYTWGEIQMFMEYAFDVWPFVEVDIYVSACFWSYDPNVMYRAFSESIFSSADPLYDIVFQAEMTQWEIWMLEEALILL